MAGLKEFHSFIGKFVNPTLQVNTQAGEATISLEVNLGQALPYPHHQQQQREPGPSRPVVEREELTLVNQLRKLPMRRIQLKKLILLPMLMQNQNQSLLIQKK